MLCLNHILYLDDTQKTGRGVFTRERIAKGTVIEVAPVIVMNQQDRIHLDKTKLHDYIFEWGKESDHVAWH
ncbi:MAG: SET domain-containing protein-lysine N-methyltransferase [Ferruginibacter sp.]